MNIDTWNLDPPPGFRGLDPGAPLQIYQRRLPHWRQDGATYFVTFRQADSLPQEKLRELDALKAEWERKNPPPHSQESLAEFAKETMQRVERWLDQGMGTCRLKHSEAAELVTNAMHYFDGDRYELDCYVVMPNHVHVVLEPLQPDNFSLETILQSWKGFTSRRINPIIGLEGAFWQEESFDRIIRDEEHLYRVIQYIGNNALRAGLAIEDCPRWIRPAWVRMGWKFEE